MRSTSLPDFQLSDWFELDHVTLYLTAYQFASLRSVTDDFANILELARIENTRTPSGVHEALYFGVPGFYIECIDSHERPEYMFGLSFRAIRYGSLDIWTDHLRTRGIEYLIDTQEITDGMDTMPWFRAVEIPETKFPVFWSEYFDEFLEDVGVTIPDGDRTGKTISIHDSVGQRSVIANISAPSYENLFSFFSRSQSKHSHWDGIEIEDHRGGTVLLRQSDQTESISIMMAIDRDTQWLQDFNNGVTIDIRNRQFGIRLRGD